MAKSNLILGDCVEVIKRFPKSYFDLAIVDPPYNSINDPDQNLRKYSNDRMRGFGDPPSQEYFDQLFRVSKNQIVFGANYFMGMLPPTKCVVWWNKKQPWKNYADGELMWTSFEKPSICIEYRYHGKHGVDIDGRIHPTQKPVVLYKHLLNLFAKPGDKILDTHLGSGSSFIACDELGFEFTGIEIDEFVMSKTKTRIKNHLSQPRIFG